MALSPRSSAPARRPAPLTGWLLGLLGGLAALLGAALTPGPLRAQDLRQLEQYQQRLEAWFQQLDRNGDGRLSVEEARGSSYLEMNFQRLDSGGRGYLLPSDLAPAHRNFLGDRLRQKFAQVDRNGDGRLSPAEAKGFPWLEKRFDEVDSNGDHSVTLKEIWELRKSLAPRR